MSKQRRPGQQKAPVQSSDQQVGPEAELDEQLTMGNAEMASRIDGGDGSIPGAVQMLERAELALTVWPDAHAERSVEILERSALALRDELADRIADREDMAAQISAAVAAVSGEDSASVRAELRAQLSDGAKALRAGEHRGGSASEVAERAVGTSVATLMRNLAFWFETEEEEEAVESGYREET